MVNDFLIGLGLNPFIVYVGAVLLVVWCVFEWWDRRRAAQKKARREAAWRPKK